MLSFGDNSNIMSVCVFDISIIYFSPVYAFVKQTAVLIFHFTRSTCNEISIKCFSQEHNDVIYLFQTNQ